MQAGFQVTPGFGLQLETGTQGRPSWRQQYGSGLEASSDVGFSKRLPAGSNQEYEGQSPGKASWSCRALFHSLSPT